MYTFSSILQLSINPVTLSLRVLGHRHKPRPSKAYKLCTFDMHRRKPMILAEGVDSLPTINNQPGTQELIDHFPYASYTAMKAFIRPQGNVLLLLGMASRALHCKDGHEAGEHSKTAKQQVVHSIGRNRNSQAQEVQEVPRCAHKGHSEQQGQ